MTCCSVYQFSIAPLWWVEMRALGVFAHRLLLY